TPSSTLFPTRRSSDLLAKHVVIDNAMERFRKRQRSDAVDRLEAVLGPDEEFPGLAPGLPAPVGAEDRTGTTSPAEGLAPALRQRSEEHTSELQSRFDL